MRAVTSAREERVFGYQRDVFAAALLLPTFVVDAKMPK